MSNTTSVCQGTNRYIIIRVNETKNSLDGVFYFQKYLAAVSHIFKALIFKNVFCIFYL